MKKKLCAGIVMLVFSFSFPNSSQAQIPIAEIIKEGIEKVIKAVDLQIQRFQNETIWLQNAQKTLENTMSKVKLTEISDWVEKQRKLYDEYFQELWKVKDAISTYHRVREIIEMQLQIVKEYKAAYTLFKQDKNFTPEEIDYMYRIYTGILDKSLKNLDQVYLAINSFATQMTDAKRLEIINAAGTEIQKNRDDLQRFNNQNKILSFQRAAERGEIDVTKRLYGL
jgi:hypothetical protein